MKFDEVGEWSKIKLDILAEYTYPYSEIMSKHNFKFYYIDAFSGAGIHVDKETREVVDGSPRRILEGTHNPFCKYYFIDLNKKKVNFLKDYCEKSFPDKEIDVRQGDCNEIIRDIASGMKYENYERVLCLLDPYGLHLDWEVIEMMGKKKIFDLILNFPIMDMNRNAIWHDKERVLPKDRKRMTRFWGDESWLSIAYPPSPQLDMFKSDPREKQPNKIIADAFQKRLKCAAEFKYVSQPIPLKNSTKATIYYLFFASENKTALKIAQSIFRKYGG